MIGGIFSEDASTIYEQKWDNNDKNIRKSRRGIVKNVKNEKSY